MRITKAAKRLGTSPRMLRYRDSLGLLPTVREPPSRRPARPSRAEVAELGRRIGRIQAPAARALDFEQERALRLLSMPRPAQRLPVRSPGRR